MAKQVRVRFAPSPTGSLHVGNARAALFNWLYAKSVGGKFLLRIEDTDLERSKPEHEKTILDSLDWLGLHHDEEVVRQSDFKAEHVAAVQELMAAGKAYKCYCSAAELEKIKGGKEGFTYPGTCRDATEQDQPHVVRFQLPALPDRLSYNDLIKGKIEIDADKLDDFILLRQDGSPTYNLAVVVDDLHMQISHVIRGEDHMINTFKQIQLYQALEKAVPKFAHLPMILGPGGHRLSKRDGATSVMEYREKGFLPQALVNYLLRLGWSLGDQEEIHIQDAIKNFNLSDVSRSNAAFDFDKLNWLNSLYLHKASSQVFLGALEQADPNLYTKVQDAGWDCDKFEAIYELYRSRASNILELAQSLVGLAAHNPNWSDLTPEEQALLKEYFSQASECKTSAEFLATAKKFTKTKGIKISVLGQPLRKLLTGSTTGPGAFSLLEILELSRF